jgi:hypothetical protein
LLPTPIPRISHTKCGLSRALDELDHVEDCDVIAGFFNAMGIPAPHPDPDFEPERSSEGPPWQWTDGDTVRDVAELLRPHPSEAMRAYRACAAVNIVKNNGRECMEVIE